MELKPYKKLTGLDYELSKTVQYTEEWTQQFKNNPFIVGNVLTLSITATATAFNHGLSTTPQGWIILDKTANVDVWRTAWDDKSITLRGSGSVSIKIWVF